jgi:hypothetical protein
MPTGDILKPRETMIQCAISALRPALSAFYLDGYLFGVLVPYMF